MSDDFSRLSIVIPARNEEQFIAQTIGCLLAQDYPEDKVEILAVVADSVDRTAEVVKDIASREPRVKYLHNPHGLSSGARTLGAQASTGDIIIFIDAHVFIDSNQLLRNTVLLMKEKQVSVLSRPQLMETPHNGLFQRAVALARGSWIGHGRDSTIYTREDKYVNPDSSGASYRKEVFERIGYFDPSFDACEDVEFNHRCAKAGFRAFTSMKLAVYYYPRNSLRGLFRQMARYGAGRFRLACKHPETLSATGLIPALWILSLPVLGLLSFLWPFFLYPLAVVAIGYLLAVTSFSIVLAGRHGWVHLAILPAVYLTLHAGLGWGFLREAIYRIFSRGQPPKNKKASE